MTRPDVRTFAWLTPFVLALQLSWMNWGTHLKYVIARNLPVRDPVLDPETDMVRVVNPFGLPSNLELAIDIAIPLAIILLVGFLSARKFQFHAGRRAAAVMFTATFVAMAFVSVEFLLRNLQYYALASFGDWVREISRILVVAAVVAMVGAAIAWLAATLVLRWRARD